MTTCCDTLSSHLFVYLLCFCIKESFFFPTQLFLLFMLLGYRSTCAFRTYGFSEFGCRTSWWISGHLFTVLLHQGEFYPLFLLFILLGYGSTRAFRTYGFSESGCRTSWWISGYLFIYLLCICIKESFIHCFCCLYFWDMAVHVLSIRTGFLESGCRTSWWILSCSYTANLNSPKKHPSSQHSK